ncbi:MAG: hypothetical protein ACRDPE_02255 [Solirubrobacterales bacterium]
MSSAPGPIDAFVRDVRQQIHVAEDRGADHEDLCIVFPAGFFAMAGGWPTLELDGAIVAVVPKLWARDKADEAIAETSWAPPSTSSHVGLWAESPAFGGSLF